MRILRRIHSTYCIFIFFSGMLICFPVFLLAIFNSSFRKWAAYANRFWAYFFFIFSGYPINIKGKEHIDRSKKYVICANHFSFYDIPTLGLSPLPIVFIGKNSLAKVPVFGYMYSRLHITIDRNSMKSRYKSIDRGIEVLKKGFCLGIFPEGGIFSDNPPKMARFKDGAFRAAIQSQTPILPVALPHNWHLLPDDGKYLPRPGVATMVYTPPISTKGLTLDDIEQLKETTYLQIEKVLKEYHPNKMNEVYENS
ncbi:MAG: 1-acyl-sn-glycerol-3-phosphate acyltransferase [Cyclobacteriaceae bacterium]|nr:1-acyl-sn-glycerol-3-phosphate acyltransferase [Cyclobacteriaceae bacterium]MCH8517134.1 1-acyl-sn-glycerol-3-phosphate acyltransferase [Cyclobacteriaceae bacterium]